MSRAIKFRAWRTKHKQMDFSDSWRALWEFLEFHERTYPEAYELMQFTGLQDREGNPIYEGDIVQHRYRQDKRLQVTWIGLGWCLVNDNTHWTGWTPEVVTVIGNVHENAELLKEAE